MRTNGFTQAGHRGTFGCRVMPSDVKYYVKSAIDDEANNTAWLTSESDDPDENMPMAEVLLKIGF